MKERLGYGSLMVRLPSFQEMLLIFLEYLWAVILILNGNSVYHANMERDYYLLELCVIMTVLLLVCNLLFGRLRLTKSSVMLAVALAAYAMIYLVVQQDKMTASNYAYLFVMGLPCLVMLFFGLHRQGRLLKLFFRLVNVVCLFAVMSLFFWIFGVFLGLIKPNMYTTINWGIFSEIEGYYGLHFAFQQDTTFFPDLHLYRNSGIFAEAPMLNLWVDIALALELLVKDKPSKTKVVILCATIVTTLSTTGLIFMALCIALRCWLMFRKMKNLTKGILIFGLMTVVPVAVYAVYQIWMLKSDTQSFEMRISDYIGALTLWREKPVFGSGFANLSSLVGYVYAPDGTVGFSNSITGALATGGLWMEILYLIPHVGMMFPALTKSKKLSMLGICFFYLFFTTVFFARYIAVVLIAFGLAVLIESRYNNQVA